RTTFPLPSRATAVRRSVSPIAFSVSCSGSNASVATSGWTRTDTESATSPARATICVIPFPTPRTTPSSFTAATDGSREDHSTGGSATSLPFRSRATAAKRSVSPIPPITTTASPGGGPPPGSTPIGMTNRDVTFCRTVIVAVSEREDTETSILAVPGCTATTRPFRSTVAMPGSRLRHESGAPGTGTPSTDTSAAMRIVSPSASSVAEAGDNTICTDSGSESITSWYSQPPRHTKPNSSSPVLEPSHRIRQPHGSGPTSRPPDEAEGGDPVSLAARQAWRARWPALAPKLCVPVFRRVCSEQRCRGHECGVGRGVQRGLATAVPRAAARGWRPAKAAESWADPPRPPAWGRARTPVPDAELLAGPIELFSWSSSPPGLCGRNDDTPVRSERGGNVGWPGLTGGYLLALSGLASIRCRVELMRLLERRGKTAEEDFARRHLRGQIVVNTDGLLRAGRDPPPGSAGARGPFARTGARTRDRRR